MMKKKVMLLSALSLLSLVGCTARGYSSSNKEDSSSTPSSSTVESGVVSNGREIEKNIQIRVAYGYFEDNLVRAEVQVKDNAVYKVHFDEVKASTEYLGVIKSGVTEGANVVSGDVTSWGTTTKKYMAKYLNYNGTVYTASYSAENNGTFIYKNQAGDVFNTQFTNLNGNHCVTSDSQAKMAELYYNIVNNFVYASDAEGKRDDSIAVNQYSKASMDSNYWITNAAGKNVNGSQWRWNIELLEKAIEGKDLKKDIKVSALTRKNDDPKKNTFTWVVDGVDTGATMETYQGYIELAKEAFDGKSKVVVAYNADKSSDTTGGNQAYIAKVELVYGADNKVQKAFLNETSSFLGGFAKTDAEDADYEKVEYTKKGWSGAEKGSIAKYMSVNGDIWSADPENDDQSSYFDPAHWYSNFTKEDAHTYYGDNSYLAADFYNAAFLHEIQVSSDKEGTELYPVKFTYKTATKAEYGNTYWNDAKSENIDGSRWKWNIAKIEKVFEGVDFNDPLLSIQSPTDSKKWNLNGVDSGATMTEFPSWVRIALIASSYLVK